MSKLPVVLLTAGLLVACGQRGPLLLPSGKAPTPGTAGQVAEPAEDEDDNKAKRDGEN